MTDGHGDLDNDAYRAGYQDAASAVRSKVIEDAIERVNQIVTPLAPKDEWGADEFANDAIRDMVVKALTALNGVSCISPDQVENQGSAAARLPTNQSTGRDTRLHNDCDVGACCACAEDEKNA